MSRERQVPPVDHQAAKRLTKRLYVASALVGLLLLAVIAHVGLTVLWNNESVHLQSDGKTEAAISQVERADNFMPLQGWVTDYNLGTYHLANASKLGGSAAMDSLDQAITAFEQAELKTPAIDPAHDFSTFEANQLPPMCRIRGNHVNAYLLGGEAARVTANDHVDSTKESFGEAGSATDKDAYDQAVTDGQDTKAKALEDFTSARDSYSKAAELLQEFKCFDASLATDAKETVEKLDKRIDAVSAMEPPAWNPEEEGSGGDDQAPASPDDQGAGDTEDQEQTDSGAPEQDSNGEDATEAPAHFNEDELGRQEQLQDRNKEGNADREEADAAEGSTTPSKKQW